MAEIRLQNLSHRYPNAAADALRLGDFCWEDGGAYALLGPSGCGKSTLLNIISGLLAPSAGQVFFDGEDVTQRNSRQRNIAQVFQFPVIYDTMTVFANLAFPLRNRGINKKQIAERVYEIAALLELTHSLHDKAQGLGADQKQLISLGRGLVRKDVAAILFDEPLTVIDPHQKFKLRRLLKDIHRQFKLTLIYVTHDQSEALTFADQVAVMNAGEVVQTGTPEMLYERPAHRFVGHFIGNPGMNFLPVTLGDNVIHLQDHLLPLDSQTIAAAKGLSGPAHIGIRPEYLTVTEQQGEGALPVTLQAVENHGNHYMLNVSLRSETVRVRTAKIPMTQELFLQLPQSKTKLYVNDRLVS